MTDTITVETIAVERERVLRENVAKLTRKLNTDDCLGPIGGVQRDVLIPVNHPFRGHWSLIHTASGSRTVKHYNSMLGNKRDHFVEGAL
jgi:hypothetical protein